MLGMLCVEALATPETAHPVRHRPCEVSATSFEGWTAEKISNEWVELVIVPQLGGRVMQITFDGHPYLFVNAKFKGKYFPPSAANGKWFNYGGDKLWPLPEGSGDEQHWPGPISDQLDDGEYQLKVTSRDATCAVHLDGPADTRTGLQYSRDITMGSSSPEISFRSVMKNAVSRTIRWSMQTVTQYDTANVQDPAEYNRDFWALAPLNPQSAYFGGYQVRAGLANDPSFAASAGLFSLHWLYLENEVWLDSPAGWLAVDDATGGYAMIERFHPEEHAEYPGKASLIFYKNGAALDLDSSGKPVLRDSNPKEAPYYMEAEINSPMVELKPGETYAMDTRWFPVCVTGKVNGVTQAGTIAVPITATTNMDRIRVAGSLGVFFPGKLVAHFTGPNGEDIESVDLISVGPQIAVDLQLEIKLPAAAKRMSIRLVDDQGNDRGSLGQTGIQSGGKEF